MQQVFPNKRIEEEENRLAQIWLDLDGESFDDVVAKHGSPEYKKYYEKDLEDYENNLERGIIVN